MVAAIVGIAGAAATVYGASKSSSAANKAADAQKDANGQQIAQQKAQFDQVQQLLAPYVKAGYGGLSGQQDLLGLNGNDAQSSAITALQGSPQFQALTSQGENSILANASATGGLRGGNTQAALAQFRPALLSQLINDQYSRLGGLTSIGQNAAAGTGNAGMQTGNNITSLLGQFGQIGAGQALAQGRASTGLVNGLSQAAGGFAGYNGFGGSGGGLADAWQRYTSTGGYQPGGQVTSDGYENYFSDIRLKKNIKRIGTTRRGTPTYSWDWKTGGKSAGVLAQEVARTNPGAVAFDPDGILTVDYSKV